MATFAVRGVSYEKLGPWLGRSRRAFYFCYAQRLIEIAMNMHAFKSHTLLQRPFPLRRFFMSERLLPLAAASSPDRSERIKRQERTRQRRKHIEKPLIGGLRGESYESAAVVVEDASGAVEKLSSLNAILFQEAIEAKASEMSEEEQEAYLEKNAKYSDPTFYDKTLLEPLLFRWALGHLDQEDGELLQRIFMKDREGGRQKVLLSNYPAQLRRSLISLKPSERQRLPKLLSSLRNMVVQYKTSGAVTQYLDNKLAIREERRRNQKGLQAKEDEEEKEEREGDEEDSSVGWWNEYESSQVRALKGMAAKYSVLIEMGVKGDLEEMSELEFFTELQNVRQDLQLLLMKGSEDPVVDSSISFLKTQLVQNGQLNEDLDTFHRWIEFIKASEAFYSLREFYPALIEQQLGQLVEVDVASTTSILEDFDRPRWWMCGDGKVDERRIVALSNLGPADLVQLRFLSELLGSDLNEGVFLKWAIHPYIGPKIRSGNWFEDGLGQMSDLVRESMEEAMASEASDDLSL
jgi:hypothetical protein